MGHHHHKHPILEEIIEITGQDPALCYQCGKCSAGCPVREFAECAPNKVVRYLQLGMYDLALESKTIWLCAGCLTCSSRCPKNYELASLMDALRELAIKHNKKIPEQNVYKFHKAFLEPIRLFGRSYEIGMLMGYKFSTFKFLQDMDLAPETLLFKSKMGLLPHIVKNSDKVKEIFRKTKEAE